MPRGAAATLQVMMERNCSVLLESSSGESGLVDVGAMFEWLHFTSIGRHAAHALSCIISTAVASKSFGPARLLN